MSRYSLLSSSTLLPFGNKDILSIFLCRRRRCQTRASGTCFFNFLAAIIMYTFDLCFILPDSTAEDNFYFRLNNVFLPI